MFKFAKTVLAAVLLTSAVSLPSEAATVNFTVSSASVAFDTPLDGFANIQYSTIGLPKPLEANIDPPGINPLFRFNSSGIDTEEDSFTAVATIVLDIAGDLVGDITFTVAGLFEQWKTNDAGVLTSGKITWFNPSSNIGSPLLNVSLSNINLFSGDRINGVGTPITFEAIPASVVPLPAGVLLLGTALLGLLGLSRRRTPTLA